MTLEALRKEAKSIIASAIASGQIKLASPRQTSVNSCLRLKRRDRKAHPDKPSRYYIPPVKHTYRYPADLNQHPA